MPTNPVTFRATLKDHPSDLCLTVARLHTQFEDQGWVKNMPIMLWREKEGTMDSVLGTVVIDEDHFVRGLQELFPDYAITKIRKGPSDEHQSHRSTDRSNVGSIL